MGAVSPNSQLNLDPISIRIPKFAQLGIDSYFFYKNSQPDSYARIVTLRF